MKSEKTGCEIAWQRANIQYMQKRKEIIKYQIDALVHYKSTLQFSPSKFNDEYKTEFNI